MTSISRAVTLLCTIVVLAGATNATAGPITLQLSSGATVVTVTDGGLGDVNPLAGMITFVGPVGNWFLNASTGVDDNAPGAAIQDLSSYNGTFFGSVDPLIMSLTQTGLTSAATGFIMDFGGTMSSLASVTYAAYADDANTPFGLSQLIGTLGPFVTPSFSGSTSGSVSVTGPYSLTQVLTLQAGQSGGGTYSGDAQLTPELRTDQVPEPMMLTLFGGGLATAGAWLRRRRAARV